MMNFTSNKSSCDILIFNQGVACICYIDLPKFINIDLLLKNNFANVVFALFIF